MTSLPCFNCRFILIFDNFKKVLFNWLDPLFFSRKRNYLSIILLYMRIHAYDTYSEYSEYIINQLSTSDM